MQQTFVERVYTGIKLAIANGKYDINEFIIEQEIADQYGVSKGTAGEALHRLCMEGDLTSFPRKGYLITVLNDYEYYQIQRLRLTIESLVIKILIQTKSDDELRALYNILENQESEKLGYYTQNAYFHISMAALTGDKFIHNMIKNLTGAITHTRAYFLAIKQPEGPAQCHESIVKHICARNIEMAINCLKDDLNITENSEN